MNIVICQIKDGMIYHSSTSQHGMAHTNVCHMCLCWANQYSQHGAPKASCPRFISGRVSLLSMAPLNTPLIGGLQKGDREWKSKPLHAIVVQTILICELVAAVLLVYEEWCANRNIKYKYYHLLGNKGLRSTYINYGKFYQEHQNSQPVI